VNISAWSIRRPLPAILLFAVLCIGGLAGFRSLGVTDMPEFKVPVFSIDASLPGSTALQIESEVTTPIENAVASIGSIRDLTSTITDGVSHTTVEFDLRQNPRDAFDSVRAAMGRVQGELPAGMAPPDVMPATLPALLVTYGVSSSGMDRQDLSQWIDSDLDKRLLAVKGVARVKQVGGVQREIHVDLDPVRLLALGVSASEISTQLHAVLAEPPGGRVKVDGGERTVRVTAPEVSIRQLGALTIPLRDGRSVRLDNIGSVTDSSSQPRSAWLDGKPVIAVEVYHADGSNQVEVAARVRAVIEQMRRAQPGITLQPIDDNTRPIETVYDNAMKALYEGCLLAVAVVWLFLRDWRATVVSAVALPLSIMPTFLAMSALGFSLNQLTLLALILVIGVLVDDAIVEVENIARHLRMGKTPVRAATEAAGEIGVAVIATSLTLTAVFLPTAFMGGYIGKYFRQFGWTVAVAVLASLLVARLLTPMMAAYLLRREPVPAGGGRLMGRYLGAVDWCVSRPRAVLLAGALFCCGSVVLIGMLPKSFIPAEDKSKITVDLQVAPGSGMEDTLMAVEASRRAVGGIDEITSTYAVVGDETGTATDTATLTYTLKPIAARTRSEHQVEALLRARLAQVPGARFSIASDDSGKVMSVVLSSDDPPLLYRSAREVERQMRTLPGIGYVSSSAGVLSPQLSVRIDPAKAAELGVTSQAVGDALRIATVGDYLANLPRLRLPARQLPIRVRMDPARAGDTDLLDQLLVPGRNGTVLLSNVSDLMSDSEPVQIDRQDRRRNVTLSVELGDRPLGDVIAQVDRLPALLHLPAGVRRAASGDARSMDDLFGSFSYALLFGVLSIYVMLVLLFGGFAAPLTILVALPLSLGGAAVALMLLGRDLSLASLIGILMLMGISTKNSILLIEHVVTALRTTARSRSEAIRDACSKRVRPIVMTTLAMMAGMLPLAFDSRGDSFRSAMAVTVIGGLATSTLLSLFLVPAAFVALDDLRLWLRRPGASPVRKRSRLVRPGHPAETVNPPSR
jgi:multidrug efflux pump subunit AcrB